MDGSERWQSELEVRRLHVSALRQQLSGALAIWPDNKIHAQSGIFSVLPLDHRQILELGEQHAVHLPTSGRINVTALAKHRIPQFVAALAQVVHS